MTTPMMYCFFYLAILYLSTSRIDIIKTLLLNRLLNLFDKLAWEI